MEYKALALYSNRKIKFAGQYVSFECIFLHPLKKNACLFQISEL